MKSEPPVGPSVRARRWQVQITTTIATLEEHSQAVAEASTTMGHGITGVDDAAGALRVVANQQFAVVAATTVASQPPGPSPSPTPDARSTGTSTTSAPAAYAPPAPPPCNACSRHSDRSVTERTNGRDPRFLLVQAPRRHWQVPGFPQGDPCLPREGWERVEGE